jgi:hypothetical protein
MCFAAAVQAQDVEMPQLMLRKVNTTYLPFEYDTAGEGQFCYGQGAVEQMAYDSVSSRLFTIGGSVRALSS